MLVPLGPLFSPQSLYDAAMMIAKPVYGSRDEIHGDSRSCSDQGYTSCPQSSVNIATMSIVWYDRVKVMNKVKQSIRGLVHGPLPIRHMMHSLPCMLHSAEHVV